MASSVKTVAMLQAHEGCEDELARLLRGMVAPSRSEPGNLRYDLWQDIDNPRRFVLDEMYQDAAAVTAHRATPHFQNYLSHINELGERTVALVRAIDVANAGDA
ncbi:putative quinol monooxygenase [Paraburkholderia sp. BCC1884]|uniref:putative quinol monooxygenase n=1 Tax=Paraburkholderia sp. BCC1884 TaxID=2562668 RepID=UPI0011835C30|nr:putative quinol monooxygenase [Paraburkholderia sp. BCC1884]